MSSSNGTRKQTRAWETGETTASGRLFNITTDDVPIEELPPSGPIVVNAAGAPPPMPSASPQEKARARKDSDALAALNTPRVRKSTLESFNDEMSVMDRPLEGDVEYVDEAPRPSRLRGLALFAGVALGVGIGGGVILSRRHAAPPPAAQASAPAAATAPAAPPTAEAAPVLAAAAPAVTAPTPEAAEAAAGDDEESATEDDAAAAPAPSRGAWDKVKSKTGHGKHARSASGKSAHHHASKRTVAAKHASSRHH